MNCLSYENAQTSAIAVPKPFNDKLISRAAVGLLKLLKPLLTMIELLDTLEMWTPLKILVNFIQQDIMNLGNIFSRSE